ncbi:metal-dependent hydrolase [Natronomonas marina]|jgi:inner membrane protein|uniref:metal-dependent hydrolase n=1 Tax=Natronomonas marina TaxID=2961939 RepID=UPI0020C9B776|nr:metal-dependent hydrolase [Natronomonas marina]
MPSSVVHAGLAFLLAVGLLGTYYDRRALVVVVGVLLFPEADTLAGLVLDGAHRALLHNLLLPLAVGAVLYWDTAREKSWLRARFGAAAARIAWVGLFVHVFAHVALDWYHLEGVNLFYPAIDRFFQLGGRAYLSTADGFVQTFVEITADPDTGTTTVDAGQSGTTSNTHVANPAQPSDEPGPGPTDRRAPVAVRGWQLYFVVTGLLTLGAKRLQSSPPDDE